MTMAEGVLRDGCAVVEDGRLVVRVGLPWYRSLPLSCLESVDVRVDGRPVAVRAGTSGEWPARPAVPDDDSDWDLRDPLEVVTDSSGIRTLPRRTGRRP